MRLLVCLNVVGTAMPLVGIGACVSLQFAFLQSGKRYFV